MKPFEPKGSDLLDPVWTNLNLHIPINAAQQIL